ncbi:N/A [soil metagenome]
MSRPAKSPYEPFVCANHGTELFESALFGHERGAFTGASRESIGACELAQDGTLFLGEIGDAPLPLQPKLLRVLESRRYRRVGGRNTLDLRARVISATHLDLRSAVDARTFRADLYYRLAYLVIEVPGLDQRREDIPFLVNRFAGERGECGAFDESALDALSNLDFPGHVRQLRGVVSGLLAKEVERPIRADSIVNNSARLDGRRRLFSFLLQERLSLGEIEAATRDYLARRVDESANNVSAAARTLGTGRGKLRKALAKAKRTPLQTAGKRA